MITMAPPGSVRLRPVPAVDAGSGAYAAAEPHAREEGGADAPPSSANPVLSDD
jgi:hypothetical protein